MPFCTACGQRLGATDRFCGQCGSPVPDRGPKTAQPDSPDSATAPAHHPAPAGPVAEPPAGPVAEPPADAVARPQAEAPAGPVATGPRWAPGSGPIPLPPRSPSFRRTVLALGLPVAVLAAGLVGLLVLITSLGSDDALPRPPAPLPTATALPTSAAGSDPALTAAPSPSTPTTSATPRVTATTAAQQARELEALLDQAARTPVTATVASLTECSPTSVDASTAAATLQAARTTRTRLLDQLQDVPVDQLRDGAALRDALRDTWQAWVQADDNYLRWAQGIAAGSGCEPQNPFKLAGDVAAANARRSGTVFVAAWNQDVAGPLHRPTRQARDL